MTRVRQQDDRVSLNGSDAGRAERLAQATACHTAGEREGSEGNVR